MVTSVDTASAGSAEAIKLWGFAVAAHEALVVSLDPPAKLRVTYDRHLVMTIRWAGVLGRVNYELQIGDGTPNGWGPSIICSKNKYAPPGLTPGQKIALRIAARRATGLSNWSDALNVTVR